MRKYSAEKSRQMLEDPLNRLILRMALPTIAAQLVTWIYNLTDTFFVSTLGTSATAAVGVNYSLEQAITLGATLLSVGSGSLISRLLGEKRNDKTSKILSTAVFTGLLFSAVIMLIGLIWTDWMVMALGATEDCRAYANDYATYLLYGTPFMITALILNQSLRSEGSPMLAMIGVSIGGLLNIALDPVFIFLLEQGIAGAAIATSISKGVSCLILLFPYLAGHGTIRLSVRAIHYDLRDCMEVVSISASSFFRTAMVMVSNTLMNHVAGGFSTAFLAAVTVGSRVMKFPFAIILGFSQGYQPVVGYNWGAKRFDRVRESLRFSEITALIGAAILGALLFAFARPAVQIFGRSDAELVRVGVLVVRLECLTMPIHAFGAVLNMFYAGIGRPLEAMALSTARQGYCLIPLLFLLPALFGEMGLVACQASADLLTLALGVPMIFRALRLIRRAEADASERAHADAEAALP
ncbi:MAG: MATE family efflux transporter [Oscillospiraceae bacterium]|nr:MATE family efflux transporter [Oscillospiraceae bacterium]